MGLYAAKLITRARLKEWNQTLLLGHHLHPAELKPVAAGFARHTTETNVYPHALDRIAADKADGWRAVLATASYRLYVGAIADAVGMDDVIATNSIIGRSEEHTSELQSLMRTSYAVFCLKNKNKT